MLQKKIVICQERNVVLSAYLHEKASETEKRPAMLVLPGGGYAFCSEAEGEPVAMEYWKAGYQCFVLHYTLKQVGGWPNPLNDYDEAVEIIRCHTDDWNIDTSRICTVGFSAGGHLAACAATLAKHKPAAAILVYPCILQELCDWCQPGMPAPYQFVTPDTSPCFFAAARDDGTTDIRNTLAMEQALADKGIAFESHIYSYGGHGFSTAENNVAVSERVPNWLPDSIGWLKELLGEYTSDGYSTPKINANTNRNYDDTLSVYCTVAHLRKQGDAVVELLAPMFAGAEKMCKIMGFNATAVLDLLGGSRACDLMATVQMSKEEILLLDAQLRKLPNQL